MNRKKILNRGCTAEKRFFFKLVRLRRVQPRYVYIKESLKVLFIHITRESLLFT